MNEGLSLLIVEDDDALRERLARAFEQRGLDVRAVGTTREAAETASQDPPELALVDLRVGDESGLNLIPTLKDLDPGTRIVVLTGYGSVATAVEALRRGAVNYLTKPADADEILAAFDRHADRTEKSSVPAALMSLDRVEWEHINRVLVSCDGNISEAARALGLHRRTLQRKLSKFPVRR
jgi:two-component system response regulator RegA